MIFFDIDGTLLDDRAAVTCGLDELHVHCGSTIGLTRDELASHWHQLTEHHFRRYLRGELSMQEQRLERMRDLFTQSKTIATDAALERLFAVYLGAYEGAWTPFPDVVPALLQLTEHQLGIITNGNGDQQRRKLEQTGLARFFTVVVTPQDCGAAKPDPAIFSEACRNAGVSVSDTLYVGDDWDADVGGSLAAGLSAVWVRRTNDARQDIPTGVRVIDTLAELPSVLESSMK